MKNKNVIIDENVKKVLIIILLSILFVTVALVTIRHRIQTKISQEIVIEEKNVANEVKWFSEEYKYEYEDKIDNIDEIEIEDIIKKNIKNEIKTIIEKKIVELEHQTEYINSKELPVGIIKVTQEGVDGKQELIIKKEYKGKKLITDEQIGTIILAPALNKVIQIGIGNFEDVINENNTTEYSKQELISGLSKNMPLNKPSGLSLEQFKKMFADEKKDKNGVFKENAEYFYYIEQSYGINGVFVAAIGIHESAWGTSRIAKDKKNLFGYGAYDMNAYASAYSYNGYAAGIDMIARVLMKNYLNPKGTSIYNGEIASGKYYNGNTIEAVNKKYATDKKWADSVYKWMQYLYGRL